MVTSPTAWPSLLITMATAHSPLLKKYMQAQRELLDQYPYRQLLHSFHRCSRTNPDEGDLRGNRKLSQHQCLRYLYMGRNRRLPGYIHPRTPATVATQPSSQTTTCGGSATFTASIAGSFPTYQWQQRAVGQNWTNVVDGGQFSGATTNTPDHHGCYV